MVLFINWTQNHGGGEKIANTTQSIWLCYLPHNPVHGNHSFGHPNPPSTCETWSCWSLRDGLTDDTVGPSGLGGLLCKMGKYGMEYKCYRPHLYWAQHPLFNSPLMLFNISHDHGITMGSLISRDGRVPPVPC